MLDPHAYKIEIDLEQVRDAEGPRIFYIVDVRIAERLPAGENKRVKNMNSRRMHSTPTRRAQGWGRVTTTKNFWKRVRNLFCGCFCKEEKEMIFCKEKIYPDPRKKVKNYEGHVYSFIPVPPPKIEKPESSTTAEQEEEEEEQDTPSATTSQQLVERSEGEKPSTSKKWLKRSLPVYDPDEENWNERSEADKQALAPVFTCEFSGVMHPASLRCFTPRSFYMKQAASLNLPFNLAVKHQENERRNIKLVPIGVPVRIGTICFDLEQARQKRRLRKEKTHTGFTDFKDQKKYLGTKELFRIKIDPEEKLDGLSRLLMEEVESKELGTWV